MSAGLTRAFHERTFERYGTRAPVDAIEVVTYRLVARVPGSRAVLDRCSEQDAARAARAGAG